jgi:aspartyl/glutamyl-tRNA(Asn/Gln) amidotransferase C subunit
MKNELVNAGKIAKTARIFLTDEEVAKYQGNLEVVIPWFREMLETDIPNNIKPIYSLTTEEDGENYFEDEPKKTDTLNEVLFNVPEKKENLILVPKVI